MTWRWSVLGVLLIGSLLGPSAIAVPDAPHDVNLRPCHPGECPPGPGRT